MSNQARDRFILGSGAVLSTDMVLFHLGGVSARKGKPDVARGRCGSLRFQEQIQGPENASIARFDGLRCYQTCSEILVG